MPIRPRVLVAAVTTLSLCALMASAHSAAANAAAQEPSAAQLIERLGLRIAAQPVRERPGWRPPRIVLVSEQLHELLPVLQQQAPHAKLIDVAAATPREIAAADATIGVCSAQVLAQAKQLQWIQWPAASGRTGPDYVSYVGLPDELLKLAKDADFVVNCTPLTPQTTGIFNKELFATLRPSAYFISVGRGRSTVTADLIAALENGKLAGAGLDVVDPEPLPPQSPLWHLPNVIITPHVSAETAVAELQRNAVLVENLRRYVAGEPMLSVVDIERGY